MKALTSRQQRILAALIQIAGGNDVLQRALRVGGREDVSVENLMKRIKELRRQDRSRAASTDAESLADSLAE